MKLHYTVHPDLGFLMPAPRSSPLKKLISGLKYKMSLKYINMPECQIVPHNGWEHVKWNHFKGNVAI